MNELKIELMDGYNALKSVYFRNGREVFLNTGTLRFLFLFLQYLLPLLPRFILQHYHIRTQGGCWLNPSSSLFHSFESGVNSHGMTMSQIEIFF